MRILFDCNAVHGGYSLIEHLLPGLELINNLTGFLFRFPIDDITITCDIEGMFLQVNVIIKGNRNLVRFLWWKNGKTDEKPTDYRITAHLFGAISSSGCVNFARMTTTEMLAKAESKAADFIRHNCYVDGDLTFIQSSQEAIQLIQDSQQLCDK